MVAAVWLAGEMTPAPFWKGQAGYAEIIGQEPRILLPSFAAYLVGELPNAFGMAKLKIATEARFLWVRTIGSTVVGEGLDTLVFVTLAFAGQVPGGVLLPMMTGP